MNSKYNARLLKAVLGEKNALPNEERLASDEELDSLILELLEKNCNGTAFFLMHEYFWKEKTTKKWRSTFVKMQRKLQRKR